MISGNRPLAFVLLSPDCVAAGRVSSALDTFRSAGISISVVKSILVDRVSVSQVYRSNRMGREPSFFDGLVDELFESGPSLVCIARGDDSVTSETLHRLLKELKGPSSPFKGKPNQLRRSLGATNRVMNLLHISDDGEESKRQARLFVSESEIEQAGSAVPSLPPSRGSRCLEVSGLRVMNTLKSRAIATASTPPEKLLRSLRAEQELLNESVDQVSVYGAVFECLELQAQSLSESVSGSLRRVVDCLVALASRHALGAERLSELSFAKVLEELRAMGCPVTTWESLVLRCELADYASEAIG